ncbi:hypothetical protein NFI95_04185 [Acetobacteraceae bacterium KSS8]|uniref:Uncharacterized protein n=1 Tax=Endosaccharibacter trunci TaxID=2812733 RepID=A0ABT1W443_9PROT|nr:hypothetical protein [Acetobacteraceae bacterium KSS8]
MAPDSGDRDRAPMRRRDWAVAIGLALVLALIVAAIIRNGLAYLYG